MRRECEGKDEGESEDRGEVEGQEQCASKG